MVLTIVFLFSGHAIAREQILVGGATIGSSPYVFAVGFTTLANKYFPKYNFMVQASGGVIENLKLLNQGEIDIGLVSPNVLIAAREGTRWFKDVKDSKKERYDRIRGVFVYNMGAFHFIVKDASPIHTIYDVRGKRVALGGPGTMMALMSTAILEAHGLKKDIDYKGVNLDAATASASWQDGMVDLWCQFSEIPGGLISNSTALNPFRLVPLEDEKAIKILKDKKVLSDEEGAILTFVEPGTYPTMRNKKTAVQYTVYTGFQTHKDVNEDVVYCFTKAIFDHLDELWANVGPSSKTVNLKEALYVIPVPLHPGAAKYYREKGIIK